MAMRVLRRSGQVLAHLRTATWLLLGVTVVAVLGSWLPQMPLEATAHAAWRSGLADRYGALASLLDRLGLVRFFASPWMGAPVLLLALSLAACTLARWRSVRRSATLVSHLAPFIILAGFLLSARESWRQRLSLEPNGEPARIRADLGADLFSHPHASRFPPGVDVRLLATRLERREDAIPNCEADLAVRWSDGTSCFGTTRINRPLRCRSVDLVLLGCSGLRTPQAPAGPASPPESRADRPDGDAQSTAGIELLMVRDPGYPWVIAGFGCLVAATSWTFLWPRGGHRTGGS